MFTTKFIFCLLFMVINSDEFEFKGWDIYKNNIFLEYPEISLDRNETYYSTRLELFKAHQNDVIIEKKLKYSSLYWALLAVPEFDKIRNNNILLTKNGFIVAMYPSKEYKEEISEILKNKYNFSMSPDKIMPFYPSKIECKTTFSTKNESITITGRASNPYTNEILIYFFLAKNSKKKILFIEESKNPNNDLKIVCSFLWNTGGIIHTKRLNIRAKQIQDLGIIEKLFGKSDQVYVTRNQIGELSEEIYESLNIFDEYEITIKEFREIFTDEFIEKIPNAAYSLFDLDSNVLSNLSRYNLKREINLNEFKLELSKLFKINKKGSSIKSIDFMRNEHEIFSQKYEIIKDGVFRIFRLSDNLKCTFNYISGYETFDSNKDCEIKNFDWSIKENNVVAKKIMLAKINRSSLERNFLFDQVIQLNKETYYRRNFTIMQYSDSNGPFYEKRHDDYDDDDDDY
ncbi:unnamed protein product [Brachionus calyciflorus]|uniref:Uncharacterized protein n=1 Tax=Brachionus calyciflorus TaxID=104777 RepID=A0A814FZV4_9BILA|nr:unnamed protein product [Brachionus calyciflorus]